MHYGLPDDLMPLGLASGKLTVGLENQPQRVLQALASLGQGALLDVAPGQFLDMAGPPLPDLLEEEKGPGAGAPGPSRACGAADG